jgi:hypothetical protein
MLQRDHRFEEKYYPPANTEALSHSQAVSQSYWFRGLKMHAVDWFEASCRDTLLIHAKREHIMLDSQVVSSFAELVQAYKMLDEATQYSVRVGPFRAQGWKDVWAKNYMVAFNLVYREGNVCGFFSYLATVGLEVARKPLKGTVSVNKPRILDENGVPIRNKGTKYSRSFDVGNTQMKRKANSAALSQRPNRRSRGPLEETDMAEFINALGETEMVEFIRAYLRNGNRLGNITHEKLNFLERIGLELL